MNFFRGMKNTLYSIKNSVKRFPITVVISTLLAFFIIYLNESNMIGNSRETIEKIILILGLGIPLTLCIGFIIEKFFPKNITISILMYVFGLGFLVLYYYVFLNNFRFIPIGRYIGAMIFLILAFFYIPRLKQKDMYEYYVLDVFSSLAITFVYSFVLYLGTAAIIFTIEQLFDISIKNQLYFYIFTIVVFVFGVSLFLSKLPNINEKYESNVFNKSLNVLLLYIVIPLITIYTLILYAYFAKILITMEWPTGLVSHLVLWYSIISVGVIFLITPILEDNKVAKLFKVWFPKIVLPVLLMMFVSIYKRVDQYGITENRYFGIVLGLWVLGIMLYFSLKKPLKNIIIPISLSIVVLNSVFGPLSSFAISKTSQNNRLEKVLNNNNMISNGKISSNPDISIDDKREISNIVSYFNNNHKLDDIKILPKGFNVENMEDVLGFKYEPYYSIQFERDRYFYYGFNLVDTILDISEYDYYINMNSWNASNLEIEDLNIRYNQKNNSLEISRGGEKIGEINIKMFVEDIHTNQNTNEFQGKNIMDYDDMSYKSTVGDLEFNIIFTNVSGRVDTSSNLTIESLEFILLIKK